MLASAADAAVVTVGVLVALAAGGWGIWQIVKFKEEAEQERLGKIKAEEERDAAKATDKELEDRAGKSGVIDPSDGPEWGESI